MKDDTISRAAALDALGEEPPVWYDGEDEIAERNQWRRDVAAIKALPSAQLAQDLPNGCTDTISRAAVGDALNRIEISRNASWYEFYQKALTAVGNLPSAQPDVPDTNVGDTISRQAAIETVRKAQSIGQAHRMLIQLPSAQPEIIRCRNCKFASGDSRICMKFGHSPIGELDFCAWAERRTKDEDTL